MATVMCHFHCFLVLDLLLLISGVFSATFTLTNNCGYTVWPGALSGAGTSPLSSTGFSLSKGESRKISAPSNWSGRFWGRTYCQQDSAGKFTCVTGDCGTGKVECSGSGSTPPATLAEFTLNGAGGLDFYDVSLVDGYNLPLSVVPQHGSRGRKAGNCTAADCMVDINGVCPEELRVVAGGEGERGEAVACRSACEAFGTAEYCCSGAYGGPGTCKPTSYSRFFKRKCPRAYSYAYDDGTSTFTCAAAAGYVITFCPAISSQSGRAEVVELANNSMVFMGGSGDLVSHAPPRGMPVRGLLFVATAATLASFWLPGAFPSHE